LYTLLYLVVQEYTLPTVAQTFLLACLRTLDSGLAQVVCFYLDPAGLALLPCTRSSKTRVYATPGPSSLPTLVPISGTTLTPNTTSLSNVRVRVRNTKHSNREVTTQLGYMALKCIDSAACFPMHYTQADIHERTCNSSNNDNATHSFPNVISNNNR